MYINSFHQAIFAGRNQFDIVVYYDQNSQSETPELNHLRNAIYEYEFSKMLLNAPVMLAGGFEAWKQVIGDKGIFKENNGSPLEKQSSGDSPYQKNTHWLKNIVGQGSDQNNNFTRDKVHHSIHDYLSESNPNKESMSGYTQRTESPPIRGVFANTLFLPSNNNLLSTFTSMPMPQPVSSTTDSKAFITTYPDIRPNTSSGLTRRKTIFDDPYYKFTLTSNKHSGVPPLPPKPQLNDVLSPSAPPLPPKPSATLVPYPSSPPANDSYRTAPVSYNSFSQMGNVMIGTTGLKNLGNTCFMNSIIQCLSGTLPFARYFNSGVFRQHINKDNFLGTGGVLVEGFAALLRTMWSENYNCISPVLFRQALIQFAPQFRGSEQHDSQEFLNFLLDGIHEDCNSAVKRPSPPPETAEEEARFERLEDWQASALAWERYLERNSSVVVSLFQGQYKSRLTCLTCHTVSLFLKKNSRE
jgi:ubiquitin carboxyl-terminal hydrolase 8